MVQHTAQCILAVRCLHRQLDCLRDGSAQAPLVVGVVGDNLTACLGRHAGGGDHLCSPGLHQRAAIGLLLVADLHHVDRQFQAEHFTSQCQGGAPLTGTGFGGKVGGSLYHVVVGLGQC